MINFTNILKPISKSFSDVIGTNKSINIPIDTISQDVAHIERTIKSLKNKSKALIFILILFPSAIAILGSICHFNPFFIIFFMAFTTMAIVYQEINYKKLILSAILKLDIILNKEILNPQDTATPQANNKEFFFNHCKYAQK